MGDFTYRTREEVEEWRARCPLRRLRDESMVRSRDWGLTADEADRLSEDFDAIDQQIAESIDAASRRRSRPLARRRDRRDSTSIAKRRAPGRCRRAAEGRGKITFVQATLEALEHEMARNPRIFVMGEGIGVRGGNFRTTAGLFDKFGADRLCDTPICERGFVGLGLRRGHDRHPAR